MSMLDPHPRIKAVSPQASPASMFLGDDFHHKARSGSPTVSNTWR
jgi:hypothetical protein